MLFLADVEVTALTGCGVLYGCSVNDCTCVSGLVGKGEKITAVK
ncbi:hypothetical protein C5S53_16835 [Methanophagales archaeon]|nr:hypothetical protein C5S53_16835 [Methanophagales archaeon]